jgi:hypothetical protein
MKLVILSLFLSLLVPHLCLRGDKTEATQILKEEIRPFLALDDNAMEPASKRVQLYNELASLLTFDDFRFVLASLVIVQAIEFRSPRKHTNLVWIKSAQETRRQIYPNLESFLVEKLTSLSTRFTPPQVLLVLSSSTSFSRLSFV